ncbi:MAG: hypothetical protein S4CHLAM7_11820 [Chlamydiae bacterium]|nr:hypothetical protein [Chlamydiota bacterium]
MALKQVFDPIRKIWVSATPEEIVRQKWIEVMVRHLGFPKELLVVERGVKLLPHLKGASLGCPDRRVDLLAYAKGEEGNLFPLLLIECKCTPLNAKALAQVFGYHHYIQSKFLGLANEDEILIGYQTKEGMQTLKFLPDYSQLLKAMVSPNHS